MPMVKMNGKTKKFAYTAKGKAEAKKYAKKMGAKKVAKKMTRKGEKMPFA